MYGVSVEVVLKWGKVLGCGEMWGSQHTLLHLSPHPPHSPDTSSHTHPTPLPRTPHSPDTSLHTFSHSPPTSPHSLTLPHTPHTFPSPPPTLFHTHSPYFLTTPTLPPTLPYAPHTLSFTPRQNFHFSHLLPNYSNNNVYWKLLVNFIQNFYNKNKKWQHNIQALIFVPTLSTESGSTISYMDTLCR